MKTFSLGAILSVTTGILLADIGEVHELLDHMTGDTLFTHQLPRAGRGCEGPLREQFPSLPTEIPELDGWEACAAYLAPLIAAHGERHEVQPLRSEQHTVIDPLAEMAMNYPHVEVIQVELGGGERP